MSMNRPDLYVNGVEVESTQSSLSSTLSSWEDEFDEGEEYKGVKKTGLDRYERVSVPITLCLAIMVG